MSGSESVPLRKALKRCMLFRQFCEAHMHRNPAKQSSLAKAASISVAYTLLSGGASSLSYSNAMQISQQKTSFILFDWSAKIKDSLDNKILSFHIDRE